MQTTADVFYRLCVHNTASDCGKLLTSANVSYIVIISEINSRLPFFMNRTVYRVAHKKRKHSAFSLFYRPCTSCLTSSQKCPISCGRFQTRCSVCPSWAANENRISRRRCRWSILLWTGIPLAVRLSWLGNATPTLFVSAGDIEP